MGIYVDGSAARQLEEDLTKRQRADEEELARRRRRAKARAEQKKQAAARQAGLIRGTLIMAVTAVILFLVISLLNGTVKSNALMTEISDLESQYNTLVTQNDSKEYDINRSVDLNYIISMAESYGMERGSADKIITYRTDDSEYIQQIAELPNK